MCVVSLKRSRVRFMRSAKSCQAFYPKRMLLVTVFALVFIASAASASFAQGSIKDRFVACIPDRRKPLAAVVVSLTGERLAGKKLQSVSDDEGRYSFPGLIAG